VELKLDKDREIRFSSKIGHGCNNELYYHLECDTKGACLSELGLLLASLHIIENRIIQHIEDIEPALNHEE
jgi:hypothetical protein